jgi:predicted enzyme related to lactoylglutathione lyase
MSSWHRGTYLTRSTQTGILLWFELEDYEAAVQRAEGMNAEIVKPSHRSENLNWEFWLRDPDGYMIVLTSPLPGVTNRTNQ